MNEFDFNNFGGASTATKTPSIKSVPSPTPDKTSGFNFESFGSNNPTKINPTVKLPEKNIIQKGLSEFSPVGLVSKAGVRAGQAVADPILTLIDKISGGALSKRTPEGNLGQALTRAENTPDRVPVVGQDIKPMSEETPESVSGDAVKLASFGLGPVTGLAAYGAGNAMQENGSIGDVALQTTLATILGKYGPKIAGPILEKILTKTPGLNRINTEGVTNGIRDAVGYINKKVPNILPKAPEGEIFNGSINKAADYLEKKASGFKLPTRVNQNKIDETLHGEDKELNKIAELIRPTQSSGVGTQNGKKVLTGGGLAERYRRAQGKTSGLSRKLDYENSLEEIEAAKVVKGIVDPNADKTTNIAHLNQSIKETSDARDAFLDSNPAPTNFKEFHDYMQSIKLPSTLTKDPVSAKVFNDMKEMAIEIRSKYPWTTRGTNEARKEVDRIIQDEIKQTALGDPRTKGLNNASQILRDSFNNFNRDALRHGNMEKVNLMNEDYNFFKNERKFPLSGEGSEMSDDVLRQFLAEHHGVSPSHESENLVSEFNNYLKNLETKIKAADSIAEKQASEHGSTGLGRFFKKNPGAETVANATVGTGSKALGLGALYEATKGGLK